MSSSPNVKTQGVSSSNPFPRDLIPLNKIDWEVLNDSQAVHINSLDYLKENELNDDNLFLGIYVYDKNNDALFSKNLNKIKIWPIVFDIKKETEIGAGAYFRVYIFEKDSKKIIASTSDIKLVKKADLNNLLEVRGEPLGKRITSLEIRSSGPILFYNKDFITPKGKISSKIIRSLLDGDPLFFCTYFPNILDRIFSKAFLLKNNQTWAKNWIDFADELVPGIFADIVESENKTLEKLEENSDFQDELARLSNAWITNHKLDSKLYEALKEL